MVWITKAKDRLTPERIDWQNSESTVEKPRSSVERAILSSSTDRRFCSSRKRRSERSSLGVRTVCSRCLKSLFSVEPMTSSTKVKLVHQMKFSSIIRVRVLQVLFVCHIDHSSCVLLFWLVPVERYSFDELVSLLDRPMDVSLTDVASSDIFFHDWLTRNHFLDRRTTEWTKDLRVLSWSTTSSICFTENLWERKWDELGSLCSRFFSLSDHRREQRTHKNRRPTIPDGRRLDGEQLPALSFPGACRLFNKILRFVWLLSARPSIEREIHRAGNSDKRVTGLDLSVWFSYWELVGQESSRATETVELGIRERSSSFRMLIVVVLLSEVRRSRSVEEEDKPEIDCWISARRH